jgi:hypothetical protein
MGELMKTLIMEEKYNKGDKDWHPILTWTGVVTG